MGDRDEAEEEESELSRMTGDTGRSWEGLRAEVEGGTTRRGLRGRLMVSMTAVWRNLELMAQYSGISPPDLPCR